MVYLQTMIPIKTASVGDKSVNGCRMASLVQPHFQSTDFFPADQYLLFCFRPE